MSYYSKTKVMLYLLSLRAVKHALACPLQRR